MNRLILILFIFILLTGHTKVRAQNKCYKRYVCAGTNEATDELFRQYAAQFGNSLERDSSLDSFTYKRLSYFMSLLQATVDSHGTLYEAQKMMPKKDSAKYCHRDYFGRPDYFIKPVNLSYEVVDFLNVRPINGNQLRSEVMYLICWSKDYKKRMNTDTIVKDMFKL